MITFSQITDVIERGSNRDYLDFFFVGPEICMFLVVDEPERSGDSPFTPEIVSQELEKIFRQNYNNDQCINLCFERAEEIYRSRSIADPRQQPDPLTSMPYSLSVVIISGSRLYMGSKGNSGLFCMDDGVTVYSSLKEEVTIAPPMKVNGNLSFLLCSHNFYKRMTTDDMPQSLSESEDVYDWLIRMEKISRSRKEQESPFPYSAIAIMSR